MCRATAALHPNHAGAWRLMTVSLGLLGRIDEAKEALARTLTMQPDLSSAHVENNTVYADPADRSRFLEGLRKAGLKGLARIPTGVESRCALYSSALRMFHSESRFSLFREIAASNPLNNRFAFPPAMAATVDGSKPSTEATWPIGSKSAMSKG